MYEHLISLFAQVKPRQNCDSPAGNGNCLGNLPEVRANSASLQNGLAIVFGTLAAIAVLIIVIAAISYASSEGNPEKISKSKQTIIYALIGLIIALSAEAIVLTVLGKL
jgi:hypothetical protein